MWVVFGVIVAVILPVLAACIKEAISNTQGWLALLAKAICGSSYLQHDCCAC
jgi:hypothetical protein